MNNGIKAPYLTRRRQTCHELSNCWPIFVRCYETRCYLSRVHNCDKTKPHMRTLGCTCIGRICWMPLWIVETKTNAESRVEIEPCPENWRTRTHAHTSTHTHTAQWPQADASFPASGVHRPSPTRPAGPESWPFITPGVAGLGAPRRVCN